MKKILMLPMLALMGMIGTASAQKTDCPNVYCDWYCAGVMQVPDNDGNYSTCDQAITYCVANSATKATYASSAECEAAKAGLGTPLGWCKWGNVASGCGPVYEQTQANDCSPTANVPSTWYPGDTDGSQCKAGGGGVSVPGPNPLSVPGPLPVLQHNGMAKVTGLTLAPHSLGMQISTQKDAKLSIFDARGNMVYKSDVVAGMNIVNLQDQKQGVYFAVVSSGSLKQSLRVIVK